MASGPAGERPSIGDESDRDPPLSGLDPGTNVLVAGPPLVGKNELLLETLGRATADGGAILVSTRDDDRTALADLERVAPGLDRSRVGVVDCISGRGEESGTNDGDARTRGASSPADLTGIGIGASELLNDLHEAGATEIRLGIDSVSTLLMYAEFDRVARFLHVLSGRVDRAGGVGLYVLNPATIDAAQFDQLKTLFDGLVELRDGERGREIRIRGVPGHNTEWRPYAGPDPRDDEQ